jgi:hypothetical protein
MAWIFVADSSFHSQADYRKPQILHRYVYGKNISSAPEIHGSEIMHQDLGTPRVPAWALFKASVVSFESDSAIKSSTTIWIMSYRSRSNDTWLLLMSKQVRKKATPTKPCTPSQHSNRQYIQVTLCPKSWTKKTASDRHLQNEDEPTRSSSTDHCRSSRASPQLGTALENNAGTTPESRAVTRSSGLTSGPHT